MVPWDQILNFLALRPNASPTQTHIGYHYTPYDFLVHVDHVFFEDKFFGFRSILHRCDKGIVFAVIQSDFFLPSSRVLAIVEDIVDNTGNPDRIRTMMQDLGRNHHMQVKLQLLRQNYIKQVCF